MENSSKISILIIEDDKDTAQQYEKIFKRLVKNVYIANDGLEGISLYDKYSPDVIISDITMPYLSGLDLVKKIRENDDKTKIILLTAYSEQDKLLEAIKLKLEAYLIKPIDIEELKNIVMEISNNIEEKNIISLIGGYTWNGTNSTLCDKNNKQVKLTKNETSIFKLLGKNSEKFFSLEEILDCIYNDQVRNKKDESGRLRTTLSRLRAKLTEELIESVYGFGYKLNLKDK